MTIYMIVSISALVAIGIPLVFVITRNSTKYQRQGIVRDLSTVFGQAGLWGKTVVTAQVPVASGLGRGRFQGV